MRERGEEGSSSARKIRARITEAGRNASANREEKEEAFYYYINEKSAVLLLGA